MKINDIVRHLETIAPGIYQERYDNAGLLVGDPGAECSGAILCLDSTEAVIEEAKAKNCNLVIAHHPIIFKGLKSLTGSDYVERTVIKAIKDDIAIFAIHTNLDNVLVKGVNSKIAEKIGLKDVQVLAPKKEMVKLASQLSASELNEFTERASQVQIPDNHISVHQSTGGDSLLTVVASGHQIAYLRKWLRQNNTFYDTTKVQNNNTNIGSGIIGKLKAPEGEKPFLQRVKKTMQAGCIRHTRLLDKTIEKVAICGGAGSFLLPAAIGWGADIFITGDFKYHEFFDADGKILIADVGHYESEQFTIELLHDILSEKFPNFALHLTEVLTNPVHYL